MKLSQRLKGLDDELARDAGHAPTAPTMPSPTVPPPTRSLPKSEPVETVDPLAQLKARAQQALFARLGSRLYDSSLSDEQLQAFVRQELSEVIDGERTPLNADERKKLTTEVSDDVLGYGPIQPFLDDPTVTEIMVNTDAAIYVERSGRLQRTSARFLSEDHLRRVIERIVSQVGRRIDESSPMVDARLPDGSRVNAIVPPLAVDGPTLTIRKFAKDPFKVGDLISFGTMTGEIATLLDACVRGRLNILVSGGTGTGKTTLLNVLSSFIPEDERIVTIEDAVELQLDQDHVIRLESRPPNIEGKGHVAIRDLVRNSLRMRPDRIIVGETRGGEALDMLQAMNTGHDGSLSTVHANTPRDAIARLETMVLMAGMDLPVRAIREQVASAIDLIVQITRLRDGSRRITHVTEVHGMEGQVVTLQDVFLFDYSDGLDVDGRFRGQQRPTGIRPRFTDRLEQYGIPIPPIVFGAPIEDADAVGLRGRPGR
jgi:pilus assembly protein CpaF